jgi:FMN phosphatase YigB (HAD superfamily)
VFTIFRPDFEVAAESLAARRSGEFVPVEAGDLYPDVEPCLRVLLDAGYRIGVAANQPSSTEAVVHGLGLPFDVVASSETWGVAKPDPAFFGRIVSELRLEPNEIAYVGDRLDNDVTPAARAGMIAVFLRRGPWGWILAGRETPLDAAITIDTLADLPEALAALDGREPTGIAGSGAGGLLLAAEQAERQA